MKTVYVVMETEYLIEDGQETMSYQTPILVCLLPRAAELTVFEEKENERKRQQRLSVLTARYEYSVKESRMEQP